MALIPADMLETDGPVSVGLSNDPGDSIGVSRGNHSHAHGELPGGTLHALADLSVAGFLSTDDFLKLQSIIVGQASVLRLFNGATVDLGQAEPPAGPGEVLISTGTNGAQFEQLADLITFPTPPTPPPPTREGEAVGTDDGSGRQGVLVLGTDTTRIARVLRTDPDGFLLIASDELGEIVGLLANPLPLATGAATAAKQPALGTAGTASADVLTVQGRAGMTALKVDGSAVTQPVSGAVSVSNFPSTQNVSAIALPLPVGAATETTLAALSTKTPALGQAAMAASQPVVIASNQSAVPVSASALPLPTGAATETTLAGLSGKLPATLGSKTGAASISVVIASDTTVPISGSITASSAAVGANNAALPTSSELLGGSDGTNLQAARVFDADSGAGTQFVLGTTLRKSASGGSVEAGTSTDPLRVDPTGTTSQPITAAALPLPSGAATQTTLATLLTEATFSARTPALGQAAMVASQPVVIASNQSAVPVSGSVAVSNFPATQPVSGSVAVSNFPATQPVSGTVTISNAVALDATLSALSAKLPATLGAKTAANALAVSIASDQTVPVSAAALPLPAGAATAAKQPALGVAGTPAADVLTVQGSASMTALKVDASGTTQPVSGTVAVSNLPATQAISAAALPLPAGAATQTTLATLLTEATFSARTPALGQAAMVASQPVVIANNQSSLPVTVGNFPATQPVSAAALPLPTGAATEISLATRLADATFTGRINTLGAKTSANSTPVVLASDQASIPVAATLSGTPSVAVSNFPATQPVSAAALPLPTGAATESTLASLNTKFPALGQAAMVASLPVVLASNQSAVPVSGTVSVNGTTAVSAASLPLPAGAATEVTLALLNGKLPASLGAKLSAASLSVVMASDSTFAVSGSVSVSNFPATQPISAASLPLPVGAATEITLATRLADATLTARLNTLGAKTSANSAPVVLASDQASIPVAATISGTPNVAVSNFPATQPVSGTVTVGNASLAVTAASLPLPAGAATEVTLAAISTKTPALGQAAMVASSPVTIASNQAAFPVTVTFPATQAVSAASLPLPAGASTEVTLATRLADATLTARLNTLGAKSSANSAPVVLATDQAAIPVTGTLTASGTQTVTGTVNVGNFPSTQPVSAVALPLPSGAATEVTLATRLADATLTARINTLGAKTSANSTPVVLASDQASIPVAATITGTPNVAVSNFPATQPVSAASLPLPSGAATQTTLATLLTEATFSARMPALGQAAMAASQPVVIASNQSSLPVTVTFPATQPVSAASLPLPTGAAAEVTLAAMSGKLPATLGTKTIANALAVSIASDQTVPVSMAAQPLPTGAASETTLAAINTKTPALGQAAMTASVPVVFASNQSALAVSGSVSVAGTAAISAASLPLPAGAATEVTLATRLADATFTGRINTLGAKTSANSTPVVLASDQASIPVAATISGTPTVAVNNFPATQPISAAALPLPSGASTEITLAALSAKIPALGQAAKAASLPVVLATDQGSLSVTLASTTITGSVATTLSGTPAVSVSNFPATQPVSGTVTANLGTIAGVATEVTLAAASAKLPATLGQKASAASLSVVLSSDQGALTVAPTAASDLPASGTLNALNAAVTLATAGYQTVGFTLIAGTLRGTLLPEVSFDGGTTWSATFFDDPASGQKQSSIVFAANNTQTIRTVVGSGGASHTRVRVSAFTSGTASASLRASMRQDPSVMYGGQENGPVPPVVALVGGTDGISGGSIHAISVNTSGHVNTVIQGNVSVGNFPATQPVSGAVSVSNFPATQPVSGAVSVSNLPATQAVSAVALPLPSGASTETTLAALSAKIPALGQVAKAASLPVVLASDQGSLPVTLASTTITGTVATTLSGTPAVSVSNFPATQPVSAASLPLPTGAATEVTLSALNVKMPALGQAAMAGSQPVVIANNQSAVPISAAALPLPTGAATEVTGVNSYNALGNIYNTLANNNQRTRITDGTNLVVLKVSAAAVAADPAVPITIHPSTAALAVTAAQLPAALASGRLSVDGSGVTQPVTAASLPLPTGAATDTVLQAVRDRLPASLGSKLSAASLSVVMASDSSLAVSGTVNVGNFPATQAVSAAALPLPAGASTESTLASLSAKIPALGQAAKAASLPVVLATDQGALPVTLTSTTITGSVATTLSGTPSVAVSNFPATQPVSGSVSVTGTAAVSAVSLPLPTGAATDTVLQAVRDRLPASVGSKLAAASLSVVMASDASMVVSGTVAVSNFPATQPVSAASLPLPSGASTEVTLAALNAKVPALGQVAKAASVPVVLATDQGSLAVTLASTTITGTVATTLSGTPSVAVSNFPATQPVSAAALPLPTGAATQTTLATLLTEATFSARMPAVGQAAMAASQPVVIASNQSSLPVTVGNFPATQPVSAAALPLPAGASTEPTLLALSAKIPALGQVAKAASLPVVLATDQGSLAVTLASTTITGSVATTLSGTPSVAVSNFPATQPVSGTVIVTGVATDTVLQAVRDRLPAALVSGRLVVDGSAVTQPVSGSVNVGNFPATQPVSGTVTANLGTIAGVATEITLAALSAKTPALVSGNVPVAVQNFPATQPVSGTVTANLGTIGTVATEVTLAALNAKTPALVSGNAPVTVQNFPATQPVSGTVTANLGTVGAIATEVTLAKTAMAQCASSTLSSPTATTTSSTVLAANAGRKGVQIYNAGTVDVLVSLNAAATTLSAYSFPLTAGALWIWEGLAVYPGAITALTAAGTSALKVTEFI